MSEEALVPLDDLGDVGSGLFVEDRPEEESDSTDKGNISNGDLVTNQVRSLLELSINHSQGLKVVLLSSFILLLGHWSESEHSVDGAGVVGVELSVLVFEPLVNLSSLNGRVSVELAGPASEVTQDGSGLEDGALRSLKSRHLAEGMLGQVFGGLQLVPGKAVQLDGDVDETQQELHLSTCRCIVLGGVKGQSHFVEDIL